MGPGQKPINVPGRMAGVAAIRSSCNCIVWANYCFILSDVAARLPRRIEPSAAKDGLAQAPGIGMFGVSDPRLRAPLDIVPGDRSLSPAIAQAAQSVSEPPHIVLGQSTA